MPKNKKPQGGRPSRNFDPRYGEKKTSFHDRHGDRSTGRGGRSEFSGDADARTAPHGPSSRSPKHRGYRAADAGAPKRRWTAEERAGRDDARNARGDASGSRRDERGDRRYDDARGDGRRYEGGVRGDGRRYDGGARGEGHRFDDRPSHADRGDRRQRDDRGGNRHSDGVRRDDRSGRDGAGSFRGGDRSFRAEQPRSQGDGSSSGERSSYAAGRGRFDNDRPRRDGDRPRYTSERSHSGDRAHGDRSRAEDRSWSGDRASSGGARAHGGDRARRENDRPRRDVDRPRYGEDRVRSGDYSARGGDHSARFSDRVRDRDDRSARGGDRAVRSGGDRPQHGHDRGDGYSRGDDRGDRPRYGAAGASRGADRRRDDERSRFEGDRPRRDSSARRDAEHRPSRDNWARTGAPAAAPVEDVVHERLQAQVIAAPETEGVSFADLGLGSNIVETLANQGAAAPFPIQAATIPAILAGRDVLGRGRTGSGKTIAFGAPLVEAILRTQVGKRREIGRAPRALILAPTRELALQIDATVQPIARSVGLFTTQIYGGVPQARQVGALKKGVDIIIGTPGRIEDLIQQGRLDLSDVRIAVLDEADHMCELGFVEPVQSILRKTKEGSQKLLFSATLDREVAALVDEFLVDPAVYEVAGETQESGTIEHRVLLIDQRDKAEILTSLVDREGKTLVFTRTRDYAEMLADQFDEAGIPAVPLHGDLNQGKRTRNLHKLTSGRVDVLVATDVAARGIHVDDIDLVIQADAPSEYKTYLHRSGRTGRAGRSGRVVTLIPRARQRRMEDLLDRAEIEAPFEFAQPGDEVIEEIAGRSLTLTDLTS